MPESHLSEYQAFYRQQPFGLWREDYRTAQVAHLLALINRDTRQPSPVLDDFMPFWKKSTEQETDSWGEVTDAVLSGREKKV